MSVFDERAAGLMDKRKRIIEERVALAKSWVAPPPKGEDTESLKRMRGKMAQWRTENAMKLREVSDEMRVLAEERAQDALKKANLERKRLAEAFMASHLLTPSID